AGQAFYSASKGALHALTKTMADEVARAYHMTEFTVNAVAPGFVETPMTATVKDADREAYIQRIPLGRVAQPIEVAAPVLFLASQGASYITGTVLNVDGGMMRLG
ncbi:MAG: SDR family oxidoreductase, partial [Nanoarchaeota archaeon]|nr:SDR family oxidoreductase [Nanoarchaeota archaeon]